MWAWGTNNYGQRGNGTNVTSPIPVPVSALTGVTNIVGGGFHCMALAPKSSNISGKIAFEEIDTNAPNQIINFTLRPVNGYGEITRSISVPSSGEFLIESLPSNTTLHVKGAKYLATNFSTPLVSGQTTVLNAFLRSGDTNDDNFCDVLDLDDTIQYFGTELGDGYYSNKADFNLDGYVDVLDFSILLTNFGTEGDS